MTRHLVIVLPDGLTKQLTYSGRKLTVQCRGVTKPQGDEHGTRQPVAARIK